MAREATSDVSVSSTELVNVGKNFCLFRRDNKALALINESAAKLLLACIDDVDTQAFKPLFSPHDADPSIDRDPSHKEMLLAQLRSEGFLDGPKQRAAAPIVPPAFHAPQNAGLHSVYRLEGGPAVRLECEDEELSGLLAAALQPLQADCNCAPEIEIVVPGQAGSFAVWRDGVAIATGLDRAVVRRICLQAMLMALLPTETVAALLHASTVSIAGRAVILAGATGSGKTTLMMALIATGATYLADDLTPLQPNGRAVSPFPLAASVKKGSWSVLSRQFPRLQSCRVHHVGDRVVRYVDPAPAEAACHGAVPIGALVFPTFDPAFRAASIARIGPEEALSRLLESGSEVVGEHRSIKPVTALVNETPAWSLTFPDLRAGLEAVQMQMLAGVK
ncbi:MAG: hypothetical protein APF80_05950 [Alphaproteobacteria bacterium BRH_c36]|nr:MAG: hypothetical protein APF80_05950 [Alphaproteobacteria bacterium BRH_c36]